MIINRKLSVNYFYLLAFIFIMCGCDMKKKMVNQVFEIYGEKNVLDDMIINMEVYANSEKYPGFSTWKVVTILYKGNRFQFPENNDDIVSYVIHYTYRQQVGMFKMDAEIPKNARGGHDVNMLYILREGDHVYLKYYSRRSDVARNNPLATTDATLPQEEYFKKYSSVIYEDHPQHLKKIFDLYIPKLQSYQLYPYEKLNMDYYKKLSLEEKKKIAMPEQYLRKMNLPKDELNILLEISKNR